jgi:hypothetical protein
LPDDRERGYISKITYELATGYRYDIPMKTVSRHRPCQSCGYDLFSLAADARCPECGRGIGGIHLPKEPKNPNRVAGQLKRMQRQSRQLNWLFTAFWLLPLLCIGACWWFAASWLAWTLAIIGLISGIIQHLTELSKRREWKKHLSEIENLNATK